MKKTIKALIFTILCVVICGCSDEKNEYSEDFFAMDTFMSMTVYCESGEDAVKAAREYIRSLEKKISVTDQNSEIYALNLNKTAEISEQTRELLQYSLTLSEKTGGALDPTVYALVKAWGFTEDEHRVPSDGEISGLLKTVGAENLTLSQTRAELKNGASVDLGATAKGFVSDKCAEILRNNGVSSAILNLGGNIMLVGSKPNGEDWRIGVSEPSAGGSPCASLELSDCAAVTSGNYQRYFEHNGKIYGHIIDPKTGFPCDNGLASVTVVAKSGAYCDALSTALFVMGLERAEDFWRENRDFDAVFITENKEIYVTEGISDRFSVINDEYSKKTLFFGD